VGSSRFLEYTGFQRVMTSFLGCGVAIGTFLCDRHVSIFKQICKKLSNITHFFDLWHLKKCNHSLHDVKIMLYKSLVTDQVTISFLGYWNMVPEMYMYIEEVEV